MLALYVLATIFLTILALLLTRCRIGVTSTRQSGALGNRLQLGLLYGLISLTYERGTGEARLQVFAFRRFRLFRKRLKSAAVPRTRRQKKSRAWGLRKWAATAGRIDTADLRRRLRKLVSAMRRPRLNGSIAMGLSNPMHLGIVSGFYAALAGVIPRLRRSLVLRPDFTTRGVNWRVHFSTEFIPARLAWHGIGLWRAIKKS